MGLRCSAGQHVLDLVGNSRELPASAWEQTSKFMTLSVALSTQLEPECHKLALDNVLADRGDVIVTRVHL